MAATGSLSRGPPYVAGGDPEGDLGSGRERPVRRGVDREAVRPDRHHVDVVRAAE
jgi:hypothetical protein